MIDAMDLFEVLKAVDGNTFDLKVTKQGDWKSRLTLMLLYICEEKG